MGTNKYTYLHVVQQHWGFGWEDVSQSESAREAYNDLKAYRVNQPEAPVRMIARRELNDQGEA